MSCDRCIHCPETRGPCVVLQSCDMRETYHMRFLLHDLRHVICLRDDLLASFGIQIHNAYTFWSNRIVCLICNLIFSLCLFETGNFDSGYVVCDLGNYDSVSIVCDIHLSDCYLDFSLCLCLGLSFYWKRIDYWRHWLLIHIWDVVWSHMSIESPLIHLLRNLIDPWIQGWI